MTNDNLEKPSTQLFSMEWTKALKRLEERVRQGPGFIF
jgi:hypothetical protein